MPTTIKSSYLELWQAEIKQPGGITAKWLLIGHNKVWNSNWPSDEEDDHDDDYDADDDEHDFDDMAWPLPHYDCSENGKRMEDMCLTSFKKLPIWDTTTRYVASNQRSRQVLQGRQEVFT